MSLSSGDKNGEDMSGPRQDWERRCYALADEMETDIGVHEHEQMLLSKIRIREIVAMLRARPSHVATTDADEANARWREECATPAPAAPSSTAPHEPDCALADQIERETAQLLAMTEDRGDPEYHLLRLFINQRDRICAALRARRSATLPADIVQLLRDARHAGELGYHGGDRTRQDCPDCKLANRLIAATDGRTDT